MKRGEQHEQMQQIALKPDVHAYISMHATVSMSVKFPQAITKRLSPLAHWIVPLTGSFSTLMC